MSRTNVMAVPLNFLTLPDSRIASELVLRDDALLLFIVSQTLETFT